MAVIAGAVIGGGMSLFGGSQNKRAQNKARRLTDAQRAAAYAHLKGAQGSDQLFAGLQEAQIKKANAAALGGFDSARKAQELGAIQARQGILDRGAQAQAAQQQSIISSGLLGTSSGQGAAQDMSGAISQQLAGLDAQFAQSLADLNLNESAVESQGLNSLAQHFGQTRAYNQDIQYELANLAPVKMPDKRMDFMKYLTERDEQKAASKSTWTKDANGKWVYGPSGG